MDFLSLDENRTIWLALVVSLLIHSILFIFSGRTFIQQAQYSVQPSAQMIEVSVEQMKSGDLSSVVSLSKDTQQVVSKDFGVKVQVNPDYFQNPPPEYPELAKQMRQEGLVLLTVDVDRKGVPITVEIKQSSGYHLLDQAAIKAVSHWKFHPGSMGDIAVDSMVIVPVRFRLEK